MKYLNRMICVWDWAVLLWLNFTTIHEIYSLSLRCFLFRFFFNSPCVNSVLSIGHCGGTKAKVVVESRDPIKLNFGDKTRTHRSIQLINGIFFWHKEHRDKIAPLLAKNINTWITVACIFSCTLYKAFFMLPVDSMNSARKICTRPMATTIFIIDSQWKAYSRNLFCLCRCVLYKYHQFVILTQKSMHMNTTLIDSSEKVAVDSSVTKKCCFRWGGALSPPLMHI